MPTRNRCDYRNNPARSSISAQRRTRPGRRELVESLAAPADRAEERSRRRISRVTASAGATAKSRGFLGTSEASHPGTARSKTSGSERGLLTPLGEMKAPALEEPVYRDLIGSHERPGLISRLERAGFAAPFFRRLGPCGSCLRFLETYFIPRSKQWICERCVYEESNLGPGGLVISS